MMRLHGGCKNVGLGTIVQAAIMWEGLVCWLQTAIMWEGLASCWQQSGRTIF